MTIETAACQNLVLASASPRRRELLEGLGIRFRIDPSALPEPARRKGEPARSYVMRVARTKAREVAGRNPGCLIVAADTVVVAGRNIMGKPVSAHQAADMLGNLSGRWHVVMTGLCLMDTASGMARSACSRSRVHMRRLTRKDIDWYLSTGEYADKAGAYAIQGYASVFIDRIEGCYFNIVGFPVFTFCQLCRRLNRSLW